MVEVKLKTIYAGPRGNCGPGCVIELPDDEAKGLVDGGYAEYAKAPPAKAAKKAPAKKGK